MEPQVIQNKIQPDNSWMIKDVPYNPEKTEFEKKLEENSLTPEQLLELEKKEEEEEENKTEEQKLKEFKKMFIDKIKVIALYKCKHHPFSNPSEFTNTEKLRVQEKMGKILKNYTSDEIDEEFNTISCAILEDPKTDYSKLPIMRS